MTYSNNRSTTYVYDATGRKLQVEYVNPATTFDYCGNMIYVNGTHGLDMYDYGARFYDPGICRFTTMDPMCEKYYHLSPYIYCGNNPVNYIDPTGMDWYRDFDGTYQYNPNVKSQDDLGKGQTYLWKAKNYSKQGINYRSDGSILYNNETDAYNRMWKQADQHYRQSNKGGREVGGFILNNGKVLVLPDYANDFESSYISKYGYKINGKGELVYGNDIINIIAQIHTHQRGAGDPPPSRDDVNISKYMGKRPVFTMGHDGIIYGALANQKQESVFRLPSPFNSLDYLLKGKIKLSQFVIINKWEFKK